LIIRARSIARSSNQPNDIDAYQSRANWAIQNPDPATSRGGIFPSKQHLATLFAHARTCFLDTFNIKWIYLSTYAHIIVFACVNPVINHGRRVWKRQPTTIRSSASSPS